MTVTELADLVKRMRDAQRQYFRSQSQAALLMAKGLERDVDTAVGDILAGPHLFPPAGQQEGKAK